MTEHVQTKTEIKAVLDRFGVSPRKRFGQHFLIDGNLMRRLAASAALTGDDTILEIGPGTGGLTDLLVARAKRVIAVEIDAAMQAILQERFAGRTNFELVAGDVLANRNRIADGVLSALRTLSAADREHLKLVANLPYGVAAPALVNLLLCDTPPVLYGFTVQKEVADRLAASPRTKDYGPLSILFQSRCAIQPLAVVPPTAFWPEPQVTSTMLRITAAEKPLYDGGAPGAFMEQVRAGFAYRRKTLRFNLRRHLGAEVTDALEPHFDFDRRAEELSVAEWVALDTRIREVRPH
ncbi:MAG: 16S rRNA (adenine(1518)-N(6)/adenine(1519)-N(6))-dimethyltransferase RsmA [Planctomycetota bacterium]